MVLLKLCYDIPTKDASVTSYNNATADIDSDRLQIFIVLLATVIGVDQTSLFVYIKD